MCICPNSLEFFLLLKFLNVSYIFHLNIILKNKFCSMNNYCIDIIHIRKFLYFWRIFSQTFSNKEVLLYSFIYFRLCCVGICSSNISSTFSVTVSRDITCRNFWNYLFLDTNKTFLCAYIIAAKEYNKLYRTIHDVALCVS